MYKATLFLRHFWGKKFFSNAASMVNFFLFSCIKTSKLSTTNSYLYWIQFYLYLSLFFCLFWILNMPGILYDTTASKPVNVRCLLLPKSIYLLSSFLTPIFPNYFDFGRLTNFTKWIHKKKHQIWTLKKKKNIYFNPPPKNGFIKKKMYFK